MTASAKVVRRLLGGDIPQQAVDNLPETVAALQASIAVASTDGLRPTNAQTTNYTLVVGDLGKAVQVDSATAKTVTVPPNSAVAFPLGAVIEVVQAGAGAVTLAAGVGVIITGDTAVPAVGASLLLRKTGTNAWWSSIVGVRSGTYAKTQTPGVDMVAASAADLTALTTTVSTLSAAVVMTTGTQTRTGQLNLVGQGAGGIPLSLTATATDSAQVVTATWSAVPDTGGAQGFIFERSAYGRPLGFVFKTNGVVDTAIAVDNLTSDLILYWSTAVPGDQFRIRTGPHVLLGRSCDHPSDAYRFQMSSVVGDPAAMVDLLYLSVNTAGPAVRALRITNETNTLLSVKTDNSGVGVGTLTPGSQLHVVRSQDATTQFLLQNLNDTASAKASARIQSGSSSLFLESYPSTFTTSSLAGHAFVYTTGTADLILGTAGADRLHLAANGRVGMGGVTVPAALLDITSATDIALLRMQLPAGAAANSFVIVDSTSASVFIITSSGRARASSGSAAGPAFSFAGDSDTGIFQNTLDTIQFSTGATERARISTTAFQLTDGINLVVGTTTGTKFGTATGQKMAWWNATPVVQQARPTDAASIITLLTTLGLCA